MGVRGRVWALGAHPLLIFGFGVASYLSRSSCSEATANSTYIRSRVVVLLPERLSPQAGRSAYVSVVVPRPIRSICQLDARRGHQSTRAHREDANIKGEDEPHVGLGPWAIQNPVQSRC